ncbi:MAG TPA: 5-(carboxyamino)imidazole ribonucleotide mutase [Clostridia bacterium]|jgi:5-(carboxyamino)imidazole ribonucleotide mutase|nr:5-(carboxyamino)imidazole ribonucleotide mutase [Clostridia bacterium]
MAEKLVGIVMGSDSDLPVMKEAAEILEEFGVGYEIVISSAHRAPEKTAEYARQAVAKGLKVLIAGAGGAAHLPGVIAALTPLPVIGVPIRSSFMDGLDSLLSIVQMPSGIPVATVGVNSAKNAGLLALQIIGSADSEIREKMINYKQGLAEGVEKKNSLLQEKGYKGYLSK